MRASLLLSTLISVSVATASAEERPCPGWGHGKLLSHGGGGAPELIFEGLDLCGGMDSRVVIVPYATIEFSEDKDSAGMNSEHKDRLTRRWKEYGAQNVEVLDLDDETAAVEQMSSADYIFFGGGLQRVLMQWMAEHPAVLEAVQRRHKAGALVGGSSAGAAAMAEHMIPGEDTADLKAIKSGGTLITPGLALWPEVITDQHFLKRQRWARLISAVLDHPDLPGIAVDEQTAILVDRHAGTFEVMGNGSVVVVDARAATVAPSKRGDNQRAQNISMSVLREGDIFDWKSIE